MKNIVKSGEEDASSPLTSLPDEIILQILKKLTDLKTLCFCHLVSRRFSSIVLQLDAISFTAPLINPPFPDKNTVVDVPEIRPVSPSFSSFYSHYFKIANTFLIKFKGVKSLCIEFPSFREIGSDSRCLSKWMVKFGHRIESFMFLSPNSIFDMDGLCLNGNGDEDHNEVISRTFMQNYHISFQFRLEAMSWHMILLNLVKNLPILEKVSITDTGRRGRLSLSGKKLSEMKKWVQSASKAELNDVEVPAVSFGYVPVLKLPVSGYVMKGIYFCLMKMKDLQSGIGNDVLMNNEDGFEDKEDAAYNEAVMEILEKHMGMMIKWADGIVDL